MNYLSIVYDSDQKKITTKNYYYDNSAGNVLLNYGNPTKYRR